MPRKPRESSGTGIYHVMLRGINRQDIFDDTEDYWTFIKMMSAVPYSRGDRHLSHSSRHTQVPVPATINCHENRHPYPGASVPMTAEAANMLTFEFREAHPEIEWKQITNMSNFLIQDSHGDRYLGYTQAESVPVTNFPCKDFVMHKNGKVCKNGRFSSRRE